MNQLLNTKIYTASEARANLYNLIRAVGSNLQTFEISLRGSDPVVLINKSELESWQETLDILSNKKEITSLRKAIKQKKTISHQKVMQVLRFKNAD